MANTVYPLAKEGFLAGEIDVNTASVKCALVRGYTFSAAHKFVSDVTGAGGVLHVTSDALANPTVTNGVFDADDVAFGTVAADASAHTLLVFQSSAVTGGADVASTAQRVIAHLDTGTLIPYTPNGSSLTITWDNGVNKILSL